MFLSILVALLPVLTPPAVPPAPVPPATSAAPTLTPDQQDAISAAHLGLTPSCLAAAGYTAADATALLSQLRATQAYAQLRALWSVSPGSRPSSAAASATPSSASGQPPASGVPAAPSAPTDQRTILRSQILAAAVGADQPARADRLKRCIAGAAVGIPADLGAACRTRSQRSKVAAALIAERRATRLGLVLDSRSAAALTTVRSDSEAISAAQTTAQRLEPIKAVMSQGAAAAPQPSTP